VAINATGPKWNGDPPSLPALMIYGDSGDGAEDRKLWIRSYRRTADVVRLWNVDDNLEYVDTVLPEAPKDEFGLAYGFLRSLETWFGKRLDP